MMLYVGDSAEDRLMVDDVRKRYQNTLFRGIYGSSFNEAEQISYFEGTRSDMLVKSLDQVPALLEMIRDEDHKESQEDEGDEDRPDPRP